MLGRDQLFFSRSFPPQALGSEDWPSFPSPVWPEAAPVVGNTGA